MKTAASSTVTGPRSVPAEPDEARQCSVATGRSLTNVSSWPDTSVTRCAGDVLGEVDDVGADVAERAGAGLGLVEPPRQRRLGVGDPVLEVLRPHVPDLADPALGDELAGQRDRRHPAVGEADHRAHAVRGRLLGGGGHRLRLGDRVGQRLLAQHVLARGRARRSRSRRACPPACRCRSGRCPGARRAGASRSRSRPSRVARPPRRSARRPGRRRPAWSGVSGRSKKCGAVRQAWEWAAPMKA